MTAVVLTLAVFALAWWVCASPDRLGIAGVAVFATHPAPTLTVTALAAVALTVAAAVLAVRTLRAEGWHLVTITRPAAAPSAVAGVA